MPSARMDGGALRAWFPRVQRPHALRFLPAPLYGRFMRFAGLNASILATTAASACAAAVLASCTLDSEGLGAGSQAGDASGDGAGGSAGGGGSDGAAGADGPAGSAGTAGLGGHGGDSGSAGADGSAPDAACPSYLLPCSDKCVDPQVDPAHCGACGNACAAAQLCVGGACVTQCGAGATLCEGACVDLDIDPANCGGCGKACPQGESCVAGACALVCVGGSSLCDGACVDLQSDPASCGACGTACAADATCVAGACAPLCPGMVLCGESCADLETDEGNCGACGVVCKSVESCTDGVCRSPASCREALDHDPAAPNGVYALDLDGPGPQAPFDAYCDMTFLGGGFTLALNLDTSDGHATWWGDPLWTTNATHGEAASALLQDFKSEAYNGMIGASEILVVVHQEGARVGYKRFLKINGATLLSHMNGGDNTLIGVAVIDSDIASITPQERVVRLSTQLYANHCVATGGGCTSGTAGSPDGDRLGSHEATPSNNVGGGLGNWHDIHYCCTGQTYAGMSCAGGAFRTTSEAQGGWGTCYTGTTPGFFGTDTFGPSTNACSNVTCGNAAWSSSNGIEYDFAVYLR